MLYINTKSNKKRIVKNTLLLYGRMILTLFTALYTSRIVLNTLGIEDYGIYSVVGGVVLMFSFFNNAMSSASQRFLSYEIGKKDYRRLNATFNAVLVVHIVIAILVLILAETIGLWFLKYYLNIPNERMVAAYWVYQFSILTFITSILQVPYNAIIIAHEKMNVYAYLSIIDVTLKLISVYLLTVFSFDKLKLYSFLVFLITLLITTIYKIYTYNKFSETSFRLVKDKKLYKKLTSFSGWSLFGNIAVIGSNQGVFMILNSFLGVFINAAIGIANQVNSAVYGFISNIHLAFNPQIIKSYANKDFNTLKSLIVNASRLSYYLLLLLIIPIIFNTEYVLSLWLKIVPKYAIEFTQLVLVASLFDALAGPYWMGINASGKIKYYQIILSILQLLSLPLTFLLIYNDYSSVYVFVLKIFISILSYLFRIFYFNRIIKLDFSNYFFNSLRIIASTLLILIIMYLVRKNITINNNYINFIIFLFLEFISFIVVLFFIGINKEDKKLITNILYYKLCENLTIFKK